MITAEPCPRSLPGLSSCHFLRDDQSHDVPQGRTFVQDAAKIHAKSVTELQGEVLKLHLVCHRPRGAVV